MRTVSALSEEEYIPNSFQDSLPTIDPLQVQDNLVGESDEDGNKSAGMSDACDPYFDALSPLPDRDPQYHPLSPLGPHFCNW